jgi:hypothetical protein
MTPGTDFLLLLILACVAAPFTIHLGHNARISTLQPFILGAVVLFGTRPAMLLAGVSMAYYWFATRPRPAAHKALFNLGNFVASAFIAGRVYSAAGGRQGDVSSPESLLALLLVVLAFFVTNSGLVALAAGIELGVPPFRIWYEKYSWTISSQLAGGSLVILLGMLWKIVGAVTVFLTVPFCVLTYHFYRAYFAQASERSHLT